MYRILYEESSKLKEELTDKFLRIFPSWWVMLATLIALTIVLIVFTKYLWKPVKKMHNDRQKYIQNNIDSSNDIKKDAELDKINANNILMDARNTAKDMIEESKQEVISLKKLGQEIVEKQSMSLLEQTKQTIEDEKLKFENEKHYAIVDIALDAATKILEKEVDSSKNRKIIENYLKTIK